MGSPATLSRRPISPKSSTFQKLGRLLSTKHHKEAADVSEVSPATSAVSAQSQPESLDSVLLARGRGRSRARENTKSRSPPPARGRSPLSFKRTNQRSPSVSPVSSHRSSLESVSASLDGLTLVERGRVASRKSARVPAPPRFVLHEDGSHEHHLRNIKRQERVGQMIRDLLGAKKLRSKAVSAIPKILSSTNLEQLDREAQETVDAVSSQSELPPSLFSSLLGQVKRGEVTPYTHREDAMVQPVNPVSLKRQSLRSVSQNSAASSATVSSVGTSESFIDRYGTCQEVIGRGSFGVVRIAHKKQTGSERLYAVKEFKKKPGESENAYSKRLTNEFCISSSLKHASLINAIDLLRDSKGDYCEVMEYCSGGDLYSLIVTAGKLEYAEADCFFKQLVRAVHYMHSMGVAHRDLKPENLLLTSDGTLKVTDFGNAECFKMAWEDEVQLSRGLCGSSPYIAPEEYTEKEFDPRPVDVWSCGVIYMAMRTGRQLWKEAKVGDDFYGSYLSERRDKRGYAPIETLKRARCRNVIYSILDPVASRRLTSLQVLNSEWVRCIHCCKA